MRSALGRQLNRYGVLEGVINDANNSNTGLGPFHVPIRSAKRYSTRLSEVGKFEEKQSDENCYPAGQAFLHRVFGYRGVTVFPWMVRMHDIDLRKQYSDFSGIRTKSDNEVTRKSRHESHQHNLVSDDLHATDKAEGKLQGKQSAAASRKKQSFSKSFVKVNSSASARYVPYYQVLIDTRDRPFVSNRTDTEAVTSLGSIKNSKSVYCIGGLDYVAHEDILPYTSHEQRPIHHELLRKLFKREVPDDRATEANVTDTTLVKYTPTELLYSWRDKHAWLELSRVYRETTENIRVTVIPFYLGNATQTEQNPIRETHFHWWRYCVRLENLGEASVQLRGRNWKIYSPSTKVNFVKGPGVVGVEPLLTKSEPAFQYSSHVNLPDGSGFMWGTFRMQREDGYTFECRIPPFSLHSSLEPALEPMTDQSDSKDVGKAGGNSNDDGDDNEKPTT